MKMRFLKWVAAVVFVIGGPLAHAGTVTYVYTDPQGTPLAEADASGTITATFDYKPYGSQALGSPKAGPGYTGHVNDPDTGFVYMQARYYDPSVGIFLSTDPVAPNTGALFGFNRYDYANDNPVMNIDSDGRCTVTKSQSICSMVNKVRQALGMENYTVQRGVVLTPTLQDHISDTADSYRAKTNKTLVVTSGVRSASSQAQAMKYKITHGEGVGIYKNQSAAKQILAAYTAEIKSGGSGSDGVQAMTKTITDQMAKGVFISDHLSGNAADFRRRDMSSAEQKDFKQSASDGGSTKVLTEGVPIHFHVEYAGGN